MKIWLKFEFGLIKKNYSNSFFLNLMRSTLKMIANVAAIFFCYAGLACVCWCLWSAHSKSSWKLLRNKVVASQNMLLSKVFRVFDAMILYTLFVKVEVYFCVCTVQYIHVNTRASTSSIDILCRLWWRWSHGCTHKDTHTHFQYLCDKTEKRAKLFIDSHDEI